ncbi:hypothetical protein TNCT_623501 [Trichonephila clavata]|uniref:Uncharacterized protein n=1 Tax=Trichonephila clavata TaxID=2740835 RepID=A0A8X6LBF9_TRICU|nr:hypothetical protein TNCT_623501 [Trichonephila clavata]
MLHVLWNRGKDGMQTHYGPSPKGSLLYSRFFHRLHKKKQPWPSSPSLFFDVRAQFEDEWMPMMKKHELEDYKRYLKGESYEDMYDFPHGQLRSKPKEKISTTELFMLLIGNFKKKLDFISNLPKKRLRTILW